MTNIFISYRRSDNPDAVARIHERLVARLRNREVFYDRKNVGLGDEFPELLQKKITTASVVLVVIGPRWVDLLHERRNAGVDHVRDEVRRALASNAEVIPVLIGNAIIPTDKDLSDFPELQPLLRKNAQPVSPDPRFDAECDTLVQHLERTGPAEVAGSVLGGKYKVLQLIGEGGMGDVYIAEQMHPLRRLVAVKLIKAGMDSKDILARFDSERHVLAVMDHPNICKVLDGGTTPNGRPFFVMEYVKGTPITKYCDERKLSPQQRLELFITVCRAVQHAHQKGIIHRDIKPGNVLVEVVDGTPVPKLIDFGLAKVLGQKLTDKSFVGTEYGRWVGTLEYSSPEQAEGRFEIDPLSDIYSLGVLLYELLVGSPPFTRAELLKASEEEIRRVIKEVEPTAPSTKLSSSKNLPSIAANRDLDSASLAREVRGELDLIVMKALEKEPRNRHGTAEAFADCVRRHLANDPIPGLRPTFKGRVAKFVRKNRSELILIRRMALVVFAMAILLCASWILIADVGYNVTGAQSVRDWLDDNNLSVVRTPPTDATIGELVRQKQQSISEMVMPLRNIDGMFVYEPPNFKVYDEWTQTQMASGLYPVETLSRRDKTSLTSSLLKMQRNKERFATLRGWRYYNNMSPLEPVAWSLTALSRAAKYDTSGDELREIVIDSLREITDILDSASHSRHGKAGGWGLFVNETADATPNLYIGAIVLQGLLEMRKAEVGWKGDTALRDLHLRETAEYLIHQYGKAGWEFNDATGSHPTDTGNALLFAILLRSHLEAEIDIPAIWLKEIPRLIKRLASYPVDHPMISVFFHSDFYDENETRVNYGDRPVKLPWFPYAISLAVMWDSYCLNNSIDTRPTRRALAKLLNSTDSHVVQYHESARYFQGEVLYSLSHYKSPR